MTANRIYNLGLALRCQGRFQEAADAFFKAVWSAAWQDAGYFELARLACRAGRFAEALGHLDESLGRNGRQHGARHLRVAVLRRLGRRAEAGEEAAAGLALDRMNYGLHFERFLLTGDDTFRSLLQDKVHTYIELALDYAHAGLFDEAKQLLVAAPPADPMVFYYLGWILDQAGDAAAAEEAFVCAAAMAPDYCFPNAYECVNALEAAIRYNRSRRPCALLPGQLLVCAPLLRRGHRQLGEGARA